MTSLWKQHPKQKDEKGSSSIRAKKPKNPQAAGEDGKSVAMALTRTDKPDTGFSAEAMEVMRKWVETVNTTGVHTLRLNYAEIKAFVPADNAKSAFEANIGKCRYKDVVCLDKTRVVLKSPPDFIHASWVTHELLDNQFICCQAPLNATVGDFWRMIWQERVKQIIMLCRCEELGKNKCSQYWPLKVDDSRTFAGITVKNEKVDTGDSSIVHTRLLLSYENEQRHVDHRQWATWPDRSVPKTPMAPFRLLQFTRRCTKNPSVIHCSAGIGRTGTLVMIELVFKSLVQGKLPDMVQLTKEIRQQRAQAVQTEDQYVYIHYAIMQLLAIKNVIASAEIRFFCREYEKYLQLLNDNGGKNLPTTATSVPAPGAYKASIDEEKEKDKGSEKEKVSDRNNSNREKAKQRKKEMMEASEVLRDKDSEREKKPKPKNSDREVKEQKSDKEEKRGGWLSKMMPVLKRWREEKEKREEVEEKAKEDSKRERQRARTATGTSRSKYGSAKDDASVKGKKKKAKMIFSGSRRRRNANGDGSDDKNTDKEALSSPIVPENAAENAGASPVVGESPKDARPQGENATGSEKSKMKDSGSKRINNTATKPYTVQEADGKKSIHYHRSGQPFIKALATASGTQQPQIRVAQAEPQPKSNP